MSEQEPDSDDVPRASGMPMLGLGTWQNDDHEQCAESVRTALEAGYRHVDTAQAYRNEDAVGEGIARADVDREELFVATKVHPDDLAPGDVRATTRDRLDRLGLERVDLLYVHWPLSAYDPEETMPAFQALHDEGLVERIGVSNFEPHHIEHVRKVLDVPVFANQVEMHPLLPQEEIREFCEREGVELVAYSPLARGEVFDVPELQAVAEKHGVSEARVSLAWLREKGVAAIPKATSRAHIRDNWQSLRLELDDEDVARIDAIDRRDRQVNPDFAPESW